jgi:hypothetical protein
MIAIDHKAIAAALLFGIWMLAGCAPDLGTGLVDGGWPWRPHVISVHELSHVTRPNELGIRSVAVRIEFLDVAGDPTKAHGVLEVRVVRVNEDDDPTPTTIDLTQSSKAYERVTQTYLLLIEPDLPGLVEGRRIRIEASYTMPSGAQLSDARTLSWPGS